MANRKSDKLEVRVRPEVKQLMHGLARATNRTQGDLVVHALNYTYGFEFTLSDIATHFNSLGE